MMTADYTDEIHLGDQYADGSGTEITVLREAHGGRFEVAYGGCREHSVLSPVTIRQLYAPVAACVAALALLLPGVASAAKHVSPQKQAVGIVKRQLAATVDGVQYEQEVFQAPAGSPAKITCTRGGKSFTCTVTVSGSTPGNMTAVETFTTRGQKVHGEGLFATVDGTPS